MTYFKAPLILCTIIISILFWIAGPVAADPPSVNPEQTPGDFIYTVQPGDTLALIAVRFDLNLAEIALANDLVRPNLIFPGQQLILPGIGSPLAVPAQTLTTVGDRIHIVQPGETIFSVANRYGVLVGDLIGLNSLINPDVIQVGQPLHIPGTVLPEEEIPERLFSAINLSEPTIIQGRTLIAKVSLSEPARLRGTFAGQPIFFYESSSQQFWGMIAVHALIEPEEYALELVATLPDGREVHQVEHLNVIEGPYGSESIWVDNERSELLQPELIEWEREKLVNLWSRVSPRPRWEGPFWYPVAPDVLRVTSHFGTRRRYNDSTELSFHGGTDFGGAAGTPIYAPAAGTVVLAEPLTVRGNAVLIDHGLGLYSGYWHQSQIMVTEGQEIRQGDLIGYIGDSGLVTGPHLHWEMRLNGVAVNPLQWVRESIP